MSIVQEFNNGCVLYGLCELPPQQGLDSKEFDNHTTDAEACHGAVTPADTPNKSQVDLDPQLLEEEEERIHLYTDTQLGKEESEGDGDQPGEKDCSEGDGNQSEGEEDVGDASVHPPWAVLPPGSKPKGVSYHKINKQWEAHLWIKGRQLRNRKKKGVQIFVGNYRTEDEAKQAHDRAAIKFEVRVSERGKPYALNFPESAQAAFIAEHRDWTPRDFLWKLRRYSLKFSTGKSGLKGVIVRKSVRKRRRRGEQQVPTEPVLRFEAKIAQTVGRKMTCSIGTFDSEEEAGRAYDRALLYINRGKEEVELWHVITNFRPSTYTADEVLEAGSKLVFR